MSEQDDELEALLAPPTDWPRLADDLQQQLATAQEDAARWKAKAVRLERFIQAHMKDLEPWGPGVEEAP